ncbi:MAG: hypothetical protein AABX79_00005, partial [Nanoarchaeota archaeon]
NCEFAKCPDNVCAADVKLCPDGSYVSRTGSNCEFAKCPDNNRENETEVGDENELRVRERTREITTIGNCTIKIERKISIEDGKTVETLKRKIECADGTKTEIKIKIENRTEDGRFRERIRYEIRGEEIEVEAEDGIDLEEETNRIEYKLRARLRNGDVTDIKIMPDQASEIALERLRALNFTNFTVELREIMDRNIPRVVYNIETNKHGRFLGVFKLSLKVEGQVDPETGEFIGISKPWWAFLVLGEDSDQTEDEDEEGLEEELEISAETFNGTSEVKIKLEFATNVTEQEQIVTEVLNRLSDLNVSNLLEIEENDETIEDEEKLEVEAEIEEGFTDVEFEWRFVVDSDNAEDIINAIVERLSSLTAEDINSAFSLETEDEEEDIDETDDDENETISDISGNGVIQFVDIEGGCWKIVADNGTNYEPTNLNESFKQDGLEVEFEGKLQEDMASICQIGTLIELTEIEVKD